MIFVRERINKSRCEFIREFADLISHRNINQGIIRENIVNSINNLYETNRNNAVKGYHGIKWNSWIEEWKKTGEKIGINFMQDNKKLIKEITICIISLAQDTKYKDKDVIIGRVEAFIDGSKNLCLVTTENRSNSLKVCLMQCGPFKDIIDENNGFLDYPLETKRENKKLCLYHNNKKILEI